MKRWTDIVHSDEQNYNKAIEEELKCRTEIESGQEAVKELETKKSLLRKQLDVIDADLSKCRKELGNIVKEVQNIQKTIYSLESKLDSKKGDKYSILQNAKVILII